MVAHIILLLKLIHYSDQIMNTILKLKINIFKLNCTNTFTFICFNVLNIVLTIYILNR